MHDTLSTRIRTARHQAGLTREQMAPMLGVTLRTLARWESGETQRVTVRSVARIAQVTGKNLSWFTDGEAP